jgi:acetolactate synthase-1/2/3 large subunit
MSRRSGTRMRGSDAVLRSLEAEGVDVAFGIPGGAILPTYDAIARGTSVRHVLARHEQGAGHMAEGYARASGRVGVAIATSGPGATNLVTPIADAWMDSTPLVCVTGQVRSELIGTDAFQEIDATGITLPIVKHSWLVQDVEELPHVMKAAFHVARTGRSGPVLVDIAKDVQEAEFDFSYPDEVDLPGWRPPTKVHVRQVREAAKALLAAERPIVYVGGGVLNGDACAELRTLVELTGAPAVVTLMGKSSLPDSHPLNFGPPGMHGSKYANWALNKADLIVAVGTRFDDRVTGKVSAFAPGARVIHFDVDAAEVGKIRKAEIPVVGPLKLALAQLAVEVRSLSPDGVRPPEAWLRQVDEWRSLYPYRYRKADGVLKPQTVLEALQELNAGRDDMVFTTGVGQHQMWAMQYLQCEKPRSFITSGGLGTMGYGVPAAIGAKAARPDATVVCVDGDGCFQMTAQELATAALERLPVVVVIINNGWLGMVRQWQELFYAERFSQTHLTHSVPDYAQLAEAYGCAGFTVESEDELEPALAAAIAAGRTAVVDARCDPEEKCYPMVPAGAAAVDVIELPDEDEVVTR